MSVRAYGFCPIASANTTVEMHLDIVRWSEKGRMSSDVYVEAECNSTQISDNFTKGYVIGENLNISVTIGDFVAVKYSQSCSKKRCHFHPAFTKRKGGLPAALVTNSSITTSNNYSIFLSIVMKKTGMYHESLHVLTIIL